MTLGERPPTRLNEHFHRNDVLKGHWKPDGWPESFADDSCSLVRDLAGSRRGS